jgi:phage terminase Nu1 subunit (DNA packaging protein)
MNITQSKLASLLGVTRGRVSQLKGEGRLVLTAAGEVDLEKTIARLRDTSEPGRAAMRLDRAEAWLRGAQREVEEENLAPPPDATAPAYREARARRESAKAELAEMEYALATGELMLIEDATFQLSDFGLTVQGGFEILADRVAAETIGLTCAAIEARLLAEVDAIIDLARERRKPR